MNKDTERIIRNASFRIVLEKKKGELETTYRREGEPGLAPLESVCHQLAVEMLYIYELAGGRLEPNDFIKSVTMDLIQDFADLEKRNKGRKPGGRK